MEAQTASPMTLFWKRIVLLGGTSGIGFAAAAMAAREGAAIVVASSRCESIDRAVAHLRKGTEQPSWLWLRCGNDLICTLLIRVAFHGSLSNSM